MKEIFLDVKGSNKGHYASAVISNGMLYVSGQLSLDLDTREVCKGDIREHSKLALANLDKVLKAVSLSRDDVVQCRVYLTKQEHWDIFNEVYKEFFQSHKPARTITIVNELHFGCLVEIDAVAEVNSNES